MIRQGVRRMRIGKYATALVLAVSLAGCADPLAQRASEGGNGADLPAVLVSVDDDGTTIDLAFGQSVIIDDLGVPMDSIYVESEDTAIVFPVQPSEGDGRAGVVAVGEGYTRVTVWKAFPTGADDVPALTFEVSISRLE